MCLSPARLPDNTLVACRRCDLCRSNRLNDLVGRCIAEQTTASHTFAVTLTYSGDGPETAVLNYVDVQNFLKRIRKDNYKVRYICAGEYGRSKGRAHWHIILFFYGKAPEVELDRRVDWHYWPHGFSYFQQPDFKGFRYIMKYALKNDSDEASTRALTMSKKPPLGYSFFIQMARDLVSRRLPIHSPEYSFADVKNRHGRVIRYWLQGRMREIFLEEYASLWRDRYNEEPPWADWFVENHQDKVARQEMSIDPERFLKDIEAKRPKINPKPIDFEFLSEGHDPFRATRSAIGYLLLQEKAGHGIIVAYSDETAELVIGEDQQWTIENVENVANVETQLQRSGVKSSNVKPVCAWLLAQWQRDRPAPTRRGGLPARM